MTNLFTQDLVLSEQRASFCFKNTSLYLRIEALSIGKAEAVEDLNYADRIVQAIESYLIREGFIDPSNRTSASNG